nr:M23 family metallopeptidase [Streptomyces albireticuli]
MASNEPALGDSPLPHAPSLPAGYGMPYVTDHAAAHAPEPGHAAEYASEYAPEYEAGYGYGSGYEAEYASGPYTAGYENAHVPEYTADYGSEPLPGPVPGLVPGYMPAYVEPGGRAEPEEASGPVSAGPVVPAPAPSSASARGRHRVAKQRGGTMARSGAVLGVGVMAAVGAGGMASAQDRPPAPISVPDLSGIPGVGAFMSKGDAGTAEKAADGKGKAAAGSGRAAVEAAAAAPGADQPLTRAGLSAEDVARGTATAGEALRARILQQAEYQQNAADDEARDAKTREAVEAQREAARERAAEVKAAKAEAREAAEAEKAEAEAKAKEEKAEAEKREHASSSPSSHGSSHGSSKGSSGSSSGSGAGARSGSYSLPVGSYTLTAGFGQAGNMWSANHTGEDFAAPTGTPVKAVGGGTITQAGWAGAYGYRIVLRLDDGTELWFCHLSSMVVTSGKVAAGDVIGRVGATGNVTGPHLHLEVRPGGAGPVDPLSWLRARGLQP